MTVTDFTDYEVIAAGDGEKLERWKDIYLLRPDPQAIWRAPFPLCSYQKLHARYIRKSTGGGHWETVRPHPDRWTVGYRDLTFAVKPMGFKHTGLFPEQAYNWNVMRSLVETRKQPQVLNLFGYTGGASVALCKSGAKVTHVDAAKNMVERCGENARLSACPIDGIRYIVDDCKKFVERELRRGRTYDAVLMDPPSYGRGPSGEMWKIEDGIYELAGLTAKLLKDPLFFLLNSYTTGLQPAVMQTILTLVMPSGRANGYELTLPVTEGGIHLPAGCSAMWTNKENGV